MRPAQDRQAPPPNKNAPTPSTRLPPDPRTRRLAPKTLKPPTPVPRPECPKNSSAEGSRAGVLVLARPSAREDGTTRTRPRPSQMPEGELSGNPTECRDRATPAVSNTRVNAV